MSWISAGALRSMIGWARDGVTVHERYAEGGNILKNVPREPKAMIVQNAEPSLQTAEVTLHTRSVGINW